MTKETELAGIVWDELGYKPGCIPEGWRCEWPAENMLPEERTAPRLDGVMSNQTYQSHLDATKLWEQVVDGKRAEISQCLDVLSQRVNKPAVRKPDHFVSDITESPVRSQSLLIRSSGFKHAAYLFRILGEDEGRGAGAPLRIAASFYNQPDYITMAWDPKSHEQVQEILGSLGAVSILQTLVAEIGDRRPVTDDRHKIDLALSVTRCLKEKASLWPRDKLVGMPGVHLPIGLQGYFRPNGAGTMTHGNAVENSHGRVTMPEFAALGNGILQLLDVPEANELTLIGREKAGLLTLRNYNIPLVEER